MGDGPVSDADIAAMSAIERHHLIHRLERPLGELMPPTALRRARRIRPVLMVGAMVGLIPWIGYLALTLPEKYVAHNWTETWVGFDVLLLGFMTATAVLALLRRQLMILTAFTSGVLLINGALRILRLTITRLYLLDPGMPLWRVPLLP
jgi:hypothetical protein